MRNEGRKVHVASLMDHCHLKNTELGPRHQKYQGRVIFRGDIVKDDSGTCTVFTAQGSLELHSPTPHQEDSPRDDEEAKSDFWTITGEFIYRHHVEPRVKLYVPREESFPVPLKYIDVTRTTFSSLDVLLERNFEDFWKTSLEKKNCQVHASQDSLY